MGNLSKSGNYPNLGKQSNELAKLGEEAEQLANQSMSEATKKAYRSDFDLFTSWCSDHDLDHLPAHPETVKLYCTHLFNLGRAVSTIVRALTSISVSHKALGLPSPAADPRVSAVLRGIQRKAGTAQRQAAPLVAAQLKKVIDAISSDMLGVRDRALLLVGWASALRRSELVALDVGDLEFCEKGLIVTVRRSKTDQVAQGYKLGLPEVDSIYCPVRALQKWLDLSQIKTGPVFVVIGTSGKGQWFIPLQNAPRLSTRSISKLIKRRVSAIGIKPDLYSGHSLRAGYITSAAEIGTPEHAIMEHTRHRSSKVLRTYIRTGQLFNNSPLPVLL